MVVVVVRYMCRDAGEWAGICWNELILIKENMNTGKYIWESILNVMQVHLLLIPSTAAQGSALAAAGHPRTEEPSSVPCTREHSLRAELHFPLRTGR